MGMLLGALGTGAIVLVPLHLLAAWGKSLSWLPNIVVTLAACGLLAGICAGLLISHSTHLILVAFVLCFIGIPSFLLTNWLPRSRKGAER